jgi:hypothetical protein
MARMKDILLSLLVFLMIQCIAAAAISIDGVRSTGEWSEDWNFGQAEGTGYDTNGPFGDKMVIFQNGNWYDEDPINDSGTGFNETMATL